MPLSQNVNVMTATANVVSSTSDGGDNSSSFKSTTSPAAGGVSSRKACRIVLPCDAPCEGLSPELHTLQSTKSTIAASNSNTQAKPKLDSDKILSSVLAQARAANVSSTSNTYEQNKRGSSAGKGVGALNTPSKSIEVVRGPVQCDARNTSGNDDNVSNKSPSNRETSKLGRTESERPACVRVAVNAAEAVTDRPTISDVVATSTHDSEVMRIPEGFQVITPDSTLSFEESETRAREMGEVMAEAWRSKLAATDAAAAQKQKHKNRQAAGVCDEEVAGNAGGKGMGKSGSSATARSGTMGTAGTDKTGRTESGAGGEAAGMVLFGGKHPDSMTMEELLYWHRYHHAIAADMYKRYAAVSSHLAHQRQHQHAQHQHYQQAQAQQQYQAQQMELTQQQHQFMTPNPSLDPAHQDIQHAFDLSPSFDQMNEFNLPSAKTDETVVDINSTSFLVNQMQQLNIMQQGWE